VITTPNAGAADLVEEGRNGYLVPARDPIRLAERMESCIDGWEELHSMRACARETAIRWRWTDFRSSFRSKLAEYIPVEPTTA
jgi:glycosyltransferase involved in cell wall biosynthesis